MNKISQIFRYIFAYWRHALLNLLFNVLSAIFSVFSLTMIIPFLQVLFGTGSLVTVAPPLALNKDALVGNFNYGVSWLIIHEGKMSTLMLLCIFVVLLYFLKNLTQYLALYFLAPIRTGVVKDLRNDLYSKILILPLAFYSEKRRGDLIARTTNDIQEVEWSIMRSFELFFREPITIILFLITLFMLSWSLTLFVLIMLPLSGLAIGRVAKVLRKQSIKSQYKMGQLMAVIEESISGLRIIKAFNAIDIADEKFREMNRDYTKLSNGIWRRGDLASPLSEFLGVLILVTILIYGGNMVLNEHSSLSAESFIGFIAIFSQLINPVKNLTTAWYQVQKGLSSLERINQVLEAEEVITEKPDALPLKEFNESLEFRNVDFSYQEDMVLKDINLTIKKGEVIALVGASGSGKSTMADMMPRFYDPVSGAILIDGKDIRDYFISDVRGLMGIVTQEPILFNDTIFNNITFGLENVNEEDVIAAAKVANSHDFIIEMEKGYQTMIGDRGGRLSGGQRQRLSIARAVLRKPQLLIFDEATSALDSESEKLVQEALDRLLEDHTSVIIAHRFSSIQHVQRIIVLNEGKIVESGTHRQLLEMNGVYKKLYDLQSMV